MSCVKYFSVVKTQLLNSSYLILLSYHQKEDAPRPLLYPCRPLLYPCYPASPVSDPIPSLRPPTPPRLVPWARLRLHAERCLQPTGGVGSDRVAGGAPARFSAHRRERDGGAEVRLGLARPRLLEQGLRVRGCGSAWLSRHVDITSRARLLEQGGAEVDLRGGVGGPQRQRRPQRLRRLRPALLPAQRVSERVERRVLLLLGWGQGWG